MSSNACSVCGATFCGNSYPQIAHSGLMVCRGCWAARMRAGVCIYCGDAEALPFVDSNMADTVDGRAVWVQPKRCRRCEGMGRGD